MAAAVATFNDPTLPGVGTYTNRSQTPRAAFERPRSSWPSTRQTPVGAKVAADTGVAPIASSTPTPPTPAPRAAAAPSPTVAPADHSPSRSVPSDVFRVLS